MTDPLLSFAAQHGIWAFLFVSLYLRQLRETDRRLRETQERETKLLEFMAAISKAFNELADNYRQLADDVDSLRARLQHTRRKSSG